MALIPKVKRDKWDAKSKKIIFVGYAEDTKGYRLMDLNNYKVIHSRDVAFIENQFPGKIKQKEKSESSVIFQQGDKEPQMETNQQADETQESHGSDSDNNYQDSEDHDDSRTQKKCVQERELELRRSTRKWKPISKEGYVSYLMTEEGEKDPEIVAEAMQTRNKNKWKQP